MRQPFSREAAIQESTACESLCQISLQTIRSKNNARELSPKGDPA